MDQELIKAGIENFNLPHDVVQLPTGGVFYKSKKKSVKVGYLTAADENILLSATQGNNSNEIMLSLLRHKLYEPDINPQELIESDIEAIFIFLRNTAFGSEYNFTINDPVTNKQFTASIELDELNIKKGEVLPNEEGMYVTTLPKSNVTVKLKPLTYGDVMEIENMSDKYPVGRVVPKITWRLNKMIQEVNGNADKSYISQFIEKLPISDSKYVRNFIKNNVPSLDLTKTIRTPSGELVTIDITFGVEFFRPFFTL